MSRRAGLLAAVLVAIALLLALWRLGYGAAIGLTWPGGSRAEGPVLAGARGKLAYVRDGDVWVYDLQRGVESRITRSGGTSSPRWSGGGGWLSFERGGRLWVVKADGTGLFAAPGGDVPASARWSPRSAHLAYSSADGSLSVLEPVNGEKGRHTLVPAGSGVGTSLAWNADVTRIAYARHQPVGQSISNEGIWSVAISGRDPIPVFVASGDYSLHLCCWSTAGSYLYFWQGTTSASLAADGVPFLVARAASSQPVEVAPSVLLHGEWIDSAARADAIAYVAGSGREATAGKSLVAASPEPARGGTTGLRAITLEESPALAPGYPAWAPENAFIAYSVGPSLTAAGGDLAASLANRRIWLVKPDSGEKRSLLSDATVPSGVSDERPMWARDGKTIVFARRLQPEAAARASGGAPAGTVELWVAQRDGGNAARVAGGLPDPGLGDHGYVSWEDYFDYYRG